MSAAIFPFPALVSAPVMQPRRRGRLPSSVRSLVTHQAADVMTTAQSAAAQKQALQALCMQTMIRIDRGEVTGLLLIAACANEADEVAASGTFATNPGYATRCLEVAGDVLADLSAKAVRP